MRSSYREKFRGRLQRLQDQLQLGGNLGKFSMGEDHRAIKDLVVFCRRRPGGLLP